MFTAKVYDMLGKLLIKDIIRKGTKNIFLNLENYRVGIYRLQIKIDGTILNKKLIKK